ncbi:MAG TPA: FhaA domain-containing protein [Bryobacteraceae bacterium]|nr:FhaA domain-containing protein [Bryobacteraceae bacterium]
MPSIDSVTPEEIIDAIVEEMQSQAAPSRYSVLVPSVYHVFLHPEDHERLRTVFPHIEREAVLALNESLSGLNKKNRSPIEIFSPSKRQKTYRRVNENEWKIYFYENHDQQAEDDPLIVKSLFDEPRPSEDRAGTATERATRPAASHSTGSQKLSETSRSHEASVYATLEFQDDHGPQIYEMTKSFIRVGRKVKDDTMKNKIWVDLVVSVAANVSKEHCEIRWDPSAKSFFLKDTSKFGTSVNGHLVSKDGEVRLPGKSKIQLADAVTLQFHSRTS